MKTHATFLMALALAAPCGAQDEPIDMSNAIPTTLTSLRHSPGTFVDVVVRFPVQFASIGTLQNPFFTRFVASDYANFLAWADEQHIWRKDEFDNAFGNLFVSKEHPALEGLFKLHRYERVWVTGLVRSTFRDQPWIEVHAFEPMQGEVNTATLSHMYRGERYMADREWIRAISELSLAPASGMPPMVLANVHKLTGVCYLRLGEADDAHAHLDMAAALHPDDPDLQRLLATAQTNPEAALDREVNVREINDHERPMWEAFADVNAAPPAPQG